MVDQVDSIATELTLRYAQYVSGVETVLRTNDRFKKSIDDLSKLGMEAPPQYADAAAKSAAKGADAHEKAAVRITAARKKQADSVKQSANEEVSAEQAAANAKRQIATDLARDEDRIRQQDLTARRRAALQARQDARQAQAPEAARPAIITGSTKPITQADHDAALARTAAARAALPAASPISNVNLSGAKPADTVAQKQVNNLALDLYDLTLKQRSAEGEVADQLAKQVEELRIIETYKAKGLSDEAAAIRAEATLADLEKIRAETAEKQAVASRAGGSTGSGVGKNATRFAEGAGLGRSFSSAATVGGIATGAVIAGVAELAKQGIEYAQSLKQDSDQLGLTTRDLQIYRAAAQSAGLTTEQLKEGIGQLGDNLGKAQEGSKAQSLIFQRLHIDIGSAATGYKTLSDILPSLSDRLSQITDKTQRQAIEQALGGEQLRKMDPILSQGAEAFDTYGRSIEKAGGILADSQIQKSAETAKKLALLNDELQRNLASTVADNAKAIEGLATAFFGLANAALQAFAHLRLLDNLDVINGGASSRIRELITGKDQATDIKENFDEALQTPQGRKALLDRNTQQLNALNVADKQDHSTDYIVPGTSGADSVVNTPQARYAAHQKAIAEHSRIVAAQRKADAENNPPPVPPQPGHPDGNVLGGPPKRGPKGKSTEDLAEAEIERTKQFNDQLASLQEESLRAQESMTGSIQERAADEKKLADAQYDKKIGDINSQLEKQLQQIAKDYPKGGGETYAAEARSRAEILKGAAKIAHDTDQQARDQETAAENAKAIAAHTDTQLSINADLLNSQLSLADTSKERLAIELKLLENAKERERNDLNTQLATLKPGSDVAVDVQRKIDSLGQRYAGQEADVRRQNESPGQQYARSLKSTSDTVEDSEVDALKQFNSELDKSVEKTLHLHGILGSIVDDLIDMAVKQALIKPLAGALFGGGGGGGGAASGAGGIGGLFGKVLGLFGGGGGASAGAGLDSSIDPALFGLASGGSFVVGGNGGTDQNTLSINGDPKVRVNQGETVAVLPANIVANNSRVSSPVASSPVIYQTIQYSGAVDIADKAFVVSIAQAQHKATVDGIRQGNTQTLQAVPARVQRKQTLGN